MRKRITGYIMKRNFKIIHLIFILFTMSAALTVLPGEIINSYGLFGEITTSVIAEDKGQAIEDIESGYRKKIQKIKGPNIINIWFEILITAVCISYFSYAIRLPGEDTIVTLKVRMDH